MRKPLQVTITVETSFSYGGKKPDLDVKPVGDRSVLCDVDGKGEGLDYMLDTFSKHNINASFFIEAGQSCYFGDEQMTKIVKKIKDAGQETQMMVQPAWFYSDEDENFPLDDKLVGRDPELNKQLITKALENYKQLAGDIPQAIRFYDSRMENSLYDIINELDIPMSSTIAIERGTSEGKELFLNAGRKKMRDVMEIPLFTYQDKDNMGGYPSKTLQIATCSWREMRRVLSKARNMDIKQIVLMTHPSDYIKCKDNRFYEMRPNRVNRDRLEKLCLYINETNEHFESSNFGSNVEVWKSTEEDNIGRFKIPTSFRNMRKVENGLNRLFWNY
ncbi:MAG: hypothetical protein P8H03_06005 [Emcibacteraceae bacterium]|nr:hypothetical protein [Emcibacteraceae bacterium]